KLIKAIIGKKCEILWAKNGEEMVNLFKENRGKKLCIAESDVESYPGMFVRNANQSNSLKGVFAPYPKETVQGGHNKLQKLVAAREDYIAKCSGRRS
ncbi:hypothetical protein PZH42_31170, partial [Bacteroides cellulosilyticus]